LVLDGGQLQIRLERRYFGMHWRGRWVMSELVWGLWRREEKLVMGELLYFTVLHLLTLLCKTVKYNNSPIIYLHSGMDLQKVKKKEREREREREKLGLPGI
jgi:hypothetical protein